ncbi:MAG: YoaK family protein [Acidimicrobiia bacterium]
MLIRDRRDGIDLSLAIVLAAVTGYVDAIGFVRLFGVFPANQSGNVVLFGIAVGDGRAGDAWRPALAMAGFALGVLLAYRAGLRIPAAHRRSSVLGVEAVALVGVALLAGDVLHAHAPMGGGKEGVALALGSLAMGLQTVAIGRVAGVSVSTTYQTGAIVRLSESAVDATPAAPPDSVVVARRALVVLAIVLACYSGGAALGTLVARSWGGALWAAVAATAACALVAGITDRSGTPRREP